MFAILVCLSYLVVTVLGQNWAGTACLVNHHGYFMDVTQQAVNRIENELQWSNLKMLNMSRTINERLFKWHAQGTVNYTNGFAVAFQKIDVTNVQNIFSTVNVNGTVQTIATIRGLLHFRNFKIGYDVLATLEDSGAQIFTGLYMYTVLSIQYDIRKNVNTNELSLISRLTSLLPGYRTMEYLPRDSVSEMLSRSFVPSQLWDSFLKWNEDHIHPYILDIAQNTAYPEIRFGAC